MLIGTRAKCAIDDMNTVSASFTNKQLQVGSVLQLQFKYTFQVGMSGCKKKCLNMTSAVISSVVSLI